MKVCLQSQIHGLYVIGCSTFPDMIELSSGPLYPGFGNRKTPQWILEIQDEVNFFQNEGIHCYLLGRLSFQKELVADKYLDCGVDIGVVEMPEKTQLKNVM